MYAQLTDEQPSKYFIISFALLDTIIIYFNCVLFIYILHWLSFDLTNTACIFLTSLVHSIPISIMFLNVLYEKRKIVPKIKFYIYFLFLNICINIFSVVLYLIEYFLFFKDVNDCTLQLYVMRFFQGLLTGLFGIVAIGDNQIGIISRT
jgi:hypothetical protein